MMRALSLLIVASSAAFTFNSLCAQSPTPIVVQAATSAPAPAPAAARTPMATTDSGDNEAQARLLRQMKAANDELLKKQEATLQRLDEIEKAAEQLKVFSKRG
jgi:hypothetical protein